MYSDDEIRTLRPDGFIQVSFKDERETYLLSKGWKRTYFDLWVDPKSLAIQTYTLLEAYNLEISYNSLSCL